MATKLLTAEEVKTIVSPARSIDPAYFDGNILWTQEVDLKPMLGAALYNDFLALFLANPLFPTNPTYKIMYDDYIKDIVACGCAFFTYKRDLISKTDNQGIMTNNTQYSKSSNVVSQKNVIMQHAEREWYYQTFLASYLCDNQALPDLVLFDPDVVVLEPHFRDFIPS